MKEVIVYLTLLLLGAQYTMTGVIIYVYMRVHSVIRKARVEKNAGLLPAHVWMIGISHLAAMTAACFQNISDPAWSWAITNMFGFILGTWALWLILKFKRDQRKLVSTVSTG